MWSDLGFLAAVGETLWEEEWNQKSWEAFVLFQVKDDGSHGGESRGGGEE